jgi:N-acetylmuramoyl-L-alanine amidase
MRKINEIIVHCSATPEGKDFTVEDIDRWHKDRGFGVNCNGKTIHIGYHYVIYRDGSVHEGRPENLVGAHCQGHNGNSIGVCYIGGVDAVAELAKDTRTPEQKDALVNLLMHLKHKYPQAKIHGHRDFARKACPSFDATNEYKNL